MRTLGKYGIKVKRNMEENYQSRFQELVNRGIIMDKLLKRENEIIDKKHKIEKQLKERYTKPVTNEFIVFARYNQMIEEMTEELLKEEIEEKI
ncbi:MAG: hypothetical protein HFJ37_02120 [Clostridia bacterium]|nr:hypothetical protein [Clostridia bacterium]